MNEPIIALNDLVTVTKTRHIVEVQRMEKMNTQANIKKLNSDEYVSLDTGEIKKFQKTENRSQSYNSLRQTFKKIRYLINNNFTGEKNELFLTLTYAENMTDPKKLYDDVRKFIMRLKYRFKDATTIDYINVVEPQQRGAWHCHVLLRFNDLQNIFVPNQEMADLWGHGFVTIKSMKNIDNIGAYLSAYLSDIELTDKTLLTAVEEKREVVSKTIEGKEKKFIKGGRLHLYPTGMNLYRKSKGIVFPERKRMKYKNIKKIVGNAAPHYSKNIKVENVDFENNITYEQYNLKRL
ncbi:MAG: hypothetical protein GX317_05085 [Staphylococcus equorum]|nr:hypothetical protein [Staphylococcus equorum]